MSFRIVTTPLRRRTENKPINNEVIIDTVHGNVGISNNGEYISGSEEIKSDFKSLKIRSKISNENLKNINLGSEANASEESFNIEKALNEGDILGSLKYLFGKYEIFVKEDDDGNLIFDDENNRFKTAVKEIVDKLYNKDIDSSSYSNQFRQILALIYIYNHKKDSSEEEIDVSYSKIRRDFNMRFLPKLISIEREIESLNRLERDLDIMLNSYVNSGELFKGLKNIDEDIIKVGKNIKDRKFVDYIFDESQRKEFQTENNLTTKQIEEGYYAGNSYFLPKDIYNKNNHIKEFQDNFSYSPLDDNFDINNDLYSIREANFYNNANKTRNLTSETNIIRYNNLFFPAVDAIDTNLIDNKNKLIILYDNRKKALDFKNVTFNSNSYLNLYFNHKENFRNGLLNLVNTSYYIKEQDFYSLYGKNENNYKVTNLNDLKETFYEYDNILKISKNEDNFNISNNMSYYPFPDSTLGYYLAEGFYNSSYKGLNLNLTNNENNENLKHTSSTNYGDYFRNIYKIMISKVKAAFKNPSNTNIPSFNSLDYFIDNIEINGNLFKIVYKKIDDKLLLLLYNSNMSSARINLIKEDSNEYLDSKEFFKSDKSELCAYAYFEIIETDFKNIEIYATINGIEKLIVRIDDILKNTNTNLKSVLSNLFKAEINDNIEVTTNFEEIKNHPLFFNNPKDFLKEE